MDFHHYEKKEVELDPCFNQFLQKLRKREEKSKETNLRIKQNDPTLRELWMGDGIEGDGGNYSLGGKLSGYSHHCIGLNTHLTTLRIVEVSSKVDEESNEFCEALKCNTSINNLILNCGAPNMMFIGNVRRLKLAGGFYHEVLKAYQKNNSYVTQLIIQYPDLRNGGHIPIAETLKVCTNLRKITLYKCDITDERLLPIVEAMRGNCKLEKLSLRDNIIGPSGCEAIATLVQHPNSNLQRLDLSQNPLQYIRNNDGLMNYKRIPFSEIKDIFSKSLCNNSSINDTYISNHTLDELVLPESESTGQQWNGNLECMLELNSYYDKSHVAIMKILSCHPIIDMEPLFQWGSDDERNLKSLPYVLAWFERAQEAADANEEEGCFHNILERKLSAIYQFALAMPLLFETTYDIMEPARGRKENDTNVSVSNTTSACKGSDAPEQERILVATAVDKCCVIL